MSILRRCGIWLTWILASCTSANQEPLLTLDHDTLIHYRHSMLTPEAIDRGELGPADIESQVLLYVAADGRQRHEQKLTVQGGGAVSLQRRGRWSISVYQPTGKDGFVSYALDLDRRGIWAHAAGDSLRMPPGSQRAGTDEVLGRPCTIWRHADAQAQIEGCYSESGIALRQTIRMQSAVINFEAVRIVDGPLDPALFTVPADWPRFDLGEQASVPTMEQVLAETADDLLHDCREDVVCLSAQAAFVDAWPRARAGEHAALTLVIGCLSSNCEGSVRIVPAIGCVYASALEKLEGPRRPDSCYNDTTVPQQSFIIDASRVLVERLRSP